LVVAPNRDGPEIEVDGQLVPAWTVGPAIETPLVARQDENSPLLRHVQLQNVLLDQGRGIQVHVRFGEATTLLESAEGAALLVAVDRPEGRILILSTNLDSSDLPLRIAFPVMMTNAVNWFMRRTNEINPAVSTGQVTSIPWDVVNDDQENQPALLIDPSGEQRLVTVSQDRVTVGPVKSTGIFGLTTPPEDDPKLTRYQPPETWNGNDDDAKRELLAVNLCNAYESDLRLAEYADQQEDDLPPAGAPAWLFLIFGSIGLVLTEWTFFNRRVIT